MSHLMKARELSNRRILILDDNESIHQDFRKLLVSEQDEKLHSLEAKLFGNRPEKKQPSDKLNFNIDSAFQGEQGVEMIKEANDQGNPYSLAFVDIRMPPGWNGVKTIQEIRKIDSNIQVVICTAYSDYSWQQLTDILGHSSSLLVLKKPFDAIEVQQIALALTEKWRLSEIVGLKMSELEEMVAIQTERLVKTNRQKDEFISAFSHELRTPLNAISGYTSALINRDSTGLSESQLSSITQIDTSSQTLLGMINDLLDLARFDSRDQTLNPCRIFPVQLFESVIRMLGPHWNRKNIKIDLHHDPYLSEILGDELKLKQIFMNLIFNAIKFSSTGGQITLTTKVNPDESVSISIADNGMGIELDIQEQIFDRYFQANKVKDEHLGGVGIGLSVAKNLAEMHGGTITFESEPEIGSVFIVTLPQQALKEQLQAIGTQSEQEEENSRSISGTRVLVVDDNALNRELLVSLLEHCGATVDIAVNGQEAIEKVSEYRPEVILMDLLMPVMGGIEATRQLKASSSLSSIPVIAVTASIDNTTLSDAREAGCFACLSKPVKEGELTEIVSAAKRLRNS